MFNSSLILQKIVLLYINKIWFLHNCNSFTFQTFSKVFIYLINVLFKCKNFLASTKNIYNYLQMQSLAVNQFIK